MDIGTPTAGEGLGLMKQSIQLGKRVIVAAAAALLLVAMPATTALAQDDATGQPDGNDVDALVAQAERLIGALLTADLDGNGVADFDASGDGVAEVNVQDFGNLREQPGSDEFNELLRATLEVGVSPSSSDTSLNAGCSAMVMSFDAQGNMIDWALGAGTDHGADSGGLLVDLFPQSATGANAFTKENPFVVGDRMVLIGDLDPGISGSTEHAVAWSVTSAAVPFGNGATGASATNGVVVGDVHLADHAFAGVAEPVGLFPVEANLEIADLLCTPSGWVQFDQGMPLLTNVGIAASGLSVLGALGLFLHARPARAWKTEEKA